MKRNKKVGKAFAILLVFLVGIGCAFLTLPAIGEEGQEQIADSQSDSLDENPAATDSNAEDGADADSADNEDSFIPQAIDDGDDGADDDAIKVSSQDGVVTVQIAGPVGWKDVSTAIPADAESVTFVGVSDDAAINFTDSDEFQIVLEYESMFDNICLRATRFVNSSETNTGLSQSMAMIFANGHAIKTTESVSTSGDIYVFGGGLETSVDKTSVYLEGGDFKLVVGGCFTNPVGSNNEHNGATPNIASSGDTNVYIGPCASAVGVLGGSLGGITTGSTNVVYSSQRQDANMFVVGSGSDANLLNDGYWSSRGVAYSAAITTGNISVTISEGAYAGNIHGVLYSSIDNDSINIENNGTVNNIWACAGSYAISQKFKVNNTSYEYRKLGVYPGADKFTTEKWFIDYYSIDTSLNIVNNGVVNAQIMSAFQYTAITGSSTIVNNGLVGDLIGAGYVTSTVSDSIDIINNGIAINIIGGTYYATSWETDVPTLPCKISVVINEAASASVVIGGSIDNSTTGEISVDVFGYVGRNISDEQKVEFLDLYSAGVSSGVYGAGMMANEIGAGRTNSFGSTTVTIHDSAEIDGNVFGGAIDGTASDTHVVIEGKVNGDVYGGGWTVEDSVYYDFTYDGCGSGYFGTSENCIVEVDGGIIARSVYGGGSMTYVSGSTSVIIRNDSVVEGNVIAAGNPYTDIYIGNSVYEFKSDSMNVLGSALVTLENEPTVKGTIYGAVTLDREDNDSNYGRFAKSTTVIFDNCTGTYNTVHNADTVQVTNSSDVTLNNGNDNEQLVRVVDLQVDGSAKLTLLSNAEILGKYSGDEDRTGTLAMAAGKCLTCETIAGKSKLSILDYRDTVPAAEQVYVLSTASSSADDGDFLWVDQRNNVSLAFKTNDNDTSQWWLVPGGVVITPVSITSYVGGGSANGSHVPVLRFNIALPDGCNFDEMTFTLHTNYKDGCTQGDGWVSQAINLTKATDEDGTAYLISALDYGLNGNGIAEEVGAHSANGTEDDTLVQRSSYLKLVDSTSEATGSLHAGVYQILKRSSDSTHWSDWYITAADPDGTVHIVDIDIPDTYDADATDRATVTVRYVSSEDEMYAYTDESVDQSQNEKVKLTKVLDTADSVDTTSGAVVVNKNDVTFYTNGDKTLGLFGASEGEELGVSVDTAKVALLFDDVLSKEDVDDVLDAGDLKELLANLATPVTESEWNMQHKYLDLVNFADGNVAVTPDGKVDVYWPYPDGITYETAGNYTFKIAHYKGLEREYMKGDDALKASEIELLEGENVEATPYGLKFETDSFSPYTLLWKENPSEEPKTEDPETPDEDPKKEETETPSTEPKQETETSEGTEAASVEKNESTGTTTDGEKAAVVKPVSASAEGPSATGDVSVAVSAIGTLGGIGAVLAAAGFRMRRKTRR
jgi:hypothetical protein